MKQKRVVSLFLFAVFLALLFTVACSGKERNPGSKGATASAISIPAGPLWPALALLKPGGNPIWFEFGPEGPRHIESPQDAALNPYEPWPHARHITGMLQWDAFLVMAVNRDGFLILGTTQEPNELTLYRVAENAFWDPYTTESFFIYEDKPSVLLYRNEFFSESSAPLLTPQVYSLDKSSPVPLAARVPALENIPSGWEAEVVRRGPDDLWYFRLKEKGQTLNETSYMRTEDLATQGHRISVEEWRNSDKRGADTPSPGIIAKSLSLPDLPDGFSYGGIHLLGKIFVVSWEEQLDAGIGAAGFMVAAFDSN